MEEILSNDEIDALLNLFQNEGMPEELEGSAEFDLHSAALNSGKVADMDLLKPNRFTRDQLQAITRIQEMVARKLGGAVSDRLRLDVVADCVAVEQLRFSTWCELLQNPMGVYVLDLDPLGSPAVLTMSAELLYGAVDRILGGTGEIRTGVKDLSEAEHAVADSLVQPVLEQLAAGIGELVPVRPRITGRFTNPGMAQVLPMQEVVLSLHFQISGQPLFGDLRLVVPYSALEPHLGSLEKGSPGTSGGPEGAYREVLGRNVKNVPAEVAIELGGTRMRLKDLMSMQIGDVIRLDAKPGDPVKLPVQGRLKFHGDLGTRGRRFAVRISRVLEG